MRTFLGSSDKIFLLLKCFLFREAIFGVSLHFRHICHLNSNIFLFFWSRPSDFKSSFKLRKGHLSTVQFSEKLPSPTESHSPGVKQSYARTSGPIRKSLWTPALDDLIYHKPENAQSWKRWPLCAHM